MELEEIKTSFSKLSTTGIAIIFSILAASGGLIYTAITKYNQITELADNYAPYNDEDVKAEINRLKL